MPTDTHKIVISADITPPGQHVGSYNAPTINEVAIVMVGNDFDLFIDKWCKKENKNKESFQSWKNLIISRIRNKIYSNLKNSNTKSLFYNAKIKQAIANLKNEFVIVPVDKANNNFAIICQKLYCDILKRELCTTNVYEKVNIEDENLIEKTEEIFF